MAEGPVGRRVSPALPPVLRSLFTGIEGDHIPPQLFAGVILNVGEGMREKATREGISRCVDLRPKRSQQLASLSRLSRFTEAHARANLVNDTHGSAPI